MGSNGAPESDSRSAAVSVQPPTVSARRAGATRVALLLFVLLVAIYHVDGSLTHVNDMVPNLSLPISLLNEGNLTFTPEEFPKMFLWELRESGAKWPVVVANWNDPIRGVPARDLFAAGKIGFVSHRYYVVASSREGEYMSRYGLGTLLTTLPAFSILHLVLGDLREHVATTLVTGKLVAACSVAGSAAFVFLIAGLYLDRGKAILVAITYALGTCVWSTSSQGLWQHGPTELYLAMSCYFLLRAPDGRRYAAVCGLATMLAIACRPTSAALGLVAAVVLARRDRRAFLGFIASGAIIGLPLLVYGYTYSGSPLGLEQAMEADKYAFWKTGIGSAWQFNIATNALGLLVSPSRGLLVFSPVLGFALAGIVPIWRKARYAELRPMSVALLLTALVQFSWFDWWGGWSYGYRPLVDTTVYLSILLIPAMGWLSGSRPLWALYHLMLAWSISVQLLGALAATGLGWNNRPVYRFEVAGRVYRTHDLAEATRRVSEGAGRLLGTQNCNVDLPECRYRLWSLRDNQIAFHLENYETERKRKLRILRRFGWNGAAGE